MEYVTPPLRSGLVDPSAYVRKTAIMGCVKIFQLSPRVVRGERPRRAPDWVRCQRRSSDRWLGDERDMCVRAHRERRH